MLKQDQEIFNILLETVSEAVIIVDDHQNIMEINTAAVNIFGYGKQEIRGKPLNMLIPSNYHTKHTEHFKAFVKKGKRRKMGEASDIFGLKKNGDIIAVEVELNPYTIYDKTYVMALVADVSRQKESEFDFMLRSKALESASNGIIITDALMEDNPIIYVNPSFEKLTGYKAKEVLGKNCRFLQGHDRKQEELDTLRTAIKNRESCLITLRNYKKDGTLFFNNLYITPITNNRGIVTNYIGVQNDVTKRIKAEQERSHLATIFDESLNEIYVFDADTLKFVNVNYGAQKNIGYTLEELQQMTPVDIKPDFNGDTFKKSIDVLLKKNVEKLEFETIHQRKDGTIYPVIVNLQLSNLGERAVFVAIILDITEQKNYIDKLERTVEERTRELQKALHKEKELNELKTKFLSLVSHEFKTPLSGILTSTMLLEKYKLTEEQEKRDKHLATVKDRVHYLNSILNDFLSIERLESGTVNYKFTNFKLSKVVNEVVYSANMLLKEGQRINYPEDIDAMSMHQDEKIIELMLSNVVQNAIKYSGENKAIDIHITQNDDNTIFTIKDQGIGIPAKDQKKIFTRYFRAENALNMQGTGIGLNIVKSHLENLGGNITFTSEENKGTTVTLTIPNTAKS